MSNQADLLRGNINRMHVTDSIEELDRMFLVAKERIEYIHMENKARIQQQQSNRTATK